MIEECHNLLNDITLRLSSCPPTVVQTELQSVNTSIANQLIDSLIYSAKTAYSYKFDPLLIPDTTSSFALTTCGKQVKGSAAVTNTRIDGLSNLFRTGDSCLGPTMATGELTASVKLGVKQVKIQTELALKLNNIEKGGHLLVSIKGVEVDTSGILPAGTLRPQLDTLRIAQLNGLVLKVTNAGFWEPTLNGLSGLCIKYFSSNIKSFIAAKLKTGINEALAKA